MMPCPSTINIWDEISRSALDCSSNDQPVVYIVCWNDHFFVLKVEEDAYYIIDTLGERLHKGCNQAYVLKFDKDTTIVRLSNERQASEEEPASDKAQAKSCLDFSGDRSSAVQSNESENSEREEEVVLREGIMQGIYLKLLGCNTPRELQTGIMKDLMGAATFHRRLQIEFRYSRLLQLMDESPVSEETGDIPEMAMMVT